MNWKKIIKNIVCIISVLFLLWIITSVIEINMNNLYSGTETQWNFFKVFFNLA